MFERYTEHARRVIFFARYEASTLGSPYIEPEHLLLGLLREDPLLRSRLQPGGIEQIRKRIEESSPIRDKVSTSVDLPLSDDAKRVLAFAAQESEALHHKVIDCGHLVLGLLHIWRTLSPSPRYSNSASTDRVIATLLSRHLCRASGNRKARGAFDR